MTSGSAAAIPDRFSARYEVAHKGITLGEAIINYEEDPDGRYRYTSLTRPVGLASLFFDMTVRESSEGTVTEEGFRPERYHYNRSGKRERQALLVFDWGKNQVTNDIAGKPWRMTVPADAKDRMVSLLQVMHDLAREERELTYRIADGGKLKTYTIRVVGREKIRTPYGSFETLRIIEERDDNDRATTMWVAPALDYLAVRIDHREHDDKFRMTLEELSGFDLERSPDFPYAEPGDIGVR